MEVTLLWFSLIMTKSWLLSLQSAINNSYLKCEVDAQNWTSSCCSGSLSRPDNYDFMEQTLTLVQKNELFRQGQSGAIHITYIPLKNSLVVLDFYFLVFLLLWVGANLFWLLPKVIKNLGPNSLCEPGSSGWTHTPSHAGPKNALRVNVVYCHSMKTQWICCLEICWTWCKSCCDRSVLSPALKHLNCFISIVNTSGLVAGARLLAGAELDVVLTAGKASGWAASGVR